MRLAEAVDVHFGGVQDHLRSRENLAVTVSALFTPPPLSTPRPFGNYGSQVIALAPEISTVGWLPEIEPARAEEALRVLAQSGADRPRFIGPGGSAIDPAELDRPLYPIMDIAPERNRTFLGVDAGSFPDRLVAIRQARDTRKVARTSPLQLVQAPGENAILLYGPVFAKDGKFLGVIGFGYKVEELFQTALVNPKGSRFQHSCQNRNVDAPLYVLNGDVGAVRSSPDAESRTTDISRSMEFGGRQLTFIYAVARDLADEAWRRGLWIFLAGLAFTAAAVSFLASIANRASALAREVGSRRSAEERLKMLIHELNHRVRNVMSVAQAVVRLSFTSAVEPFRRAEDLRRTAAGAGQRHVAAHRERLEEREFPQPYHRRDPPLFGTDRRPRVPTSRSRRAPRRPSPCCCMSLQPTRPSTGRFPSRAERCCWNGRSIRSGEEPLFRLMWRELRRTHGDPAEASWLWRIAGSPHRAARRIRARQGQLCIERLRI